MIEKIWAEAGYFALAVDDAGKYPPLHLVMAKAIAERRAAEQLQKDFRVMGGGSAELSEEDQKWNLLDRENFYRPIAIAAYAARAVDEPLYYPPLDADMAEAVKDRAETERKEEQTRFPNGRKRKLNQKQEEARRMDRASLFRSRLRPPKGFTM